MKLLFLPFLFIIAVSLVAASTPTADQSVLMEEIRRLEREFGGHLGVMAKNLDNGESVGYNAAERFPTASVIKFPVMATFFHLVDQKLVDPDQKVVLTKDDRKQGSGILQFMSDGATLSLRDAVKLMIMLSDNTATNLVLDRLAASHEARMRVVNDFMLQKGLKNTRILNRLYSWETKLQAPESIRYGIGVSTPEDMVTLSEALYRKSLADSASCTAMLDILKDQFYDDMLPRYLPRADCKYLTVAHKTGGVSETKVDVGLILSDKVNIAIAVFVDKHPDHLEEIENGGTQLAAHVSRAIWNHFTGSTGYYDHKVIAGDVDWTRFPGGRWAMYRSPAAPFPHKERMNGFRRDDGTFYPYQPHYSDSSIVVFVPDGFSETQPGTNIIVHFHGHLNDNLGVIEKYLMPQAMIAQKINALLVIPQGPYRARDSFGGKMEDEGGLKRLVDDVLSTMKKEEVIKTTKLNNVIISAHSGGYRPAAFSLDRGGLNGHITHVFLFDAFYGQHDYFRNWLLHGRGVLTAAYTEHLEQEHTTFAAELKTQLGDRLRFTRTNEEHENVVQAFFSQWLLELDAGWKQAGK